MVTNVRQDGIDPAKLIDRWEQVCQKLSTLATEMPANKFEYKPVDGLRTFADVLRHVAFWNYYVADSARGRKADGTGNELPKKEFSNKDQVIDAFKHSSAEAAAALKGRPAGLSPEMCEMVVSFIEHNCEHYGQLAVYARLTGITPPASRG